MKHLVNRFGLKCCLALSVGLGSWTSGETQSLTWLGVFRSDYSYAFDVSADGTVVVGASGGRAIRWTTVRGMWEISTSYSAAYGISIDGNVIVGYVESPRRAFRWQNGTMQTLGTLPGGDWSSANDVSSDGSVVVGWASTYGPSERRAFRWTNGMMQNLGTLPGYNESSATGVSADGRVVVGVAENVWGYNRYSRAFRWENGIMQDLGALPGYDYSVATGVSADGSVVVGSSYSTNRLSRAFRWTATRGMQDLGSLYGWSHAKAVSADGNIVVGTSEIYRGGLTYWGAFRWTERQGMEDLNITYIRLLRIGSYLREANAVSIDGRYIVGEGYNVATGRIEGFLLDTWRFGDTNGDNCIDDVDLLSVLFAFGTPGTGYTRHEDIDKNGIVDDADLLIVLLNFGQGC